MAEPSPQEREFLEFASAAVGMRRLFLSYIDAGFTESQALQLLIGITSQLAARTAQEPQ